MTEKGSSAVQSQVNETFTKTITTIGLKTVSSLLDYMSTDQVSNFIANLSSTLGDSVQDLRDIQTSATSLAGVLSSTSDSLTSAGGMLKQTGTVDESTKQLMEHAKSGINDSKEALKAANDAVDAAIDGSAGSFDNVSAELAKAFDARISMLALRCLSSTKPLRPSMRAPRISMRWPISSAALPTR